MEREAFNGVAFPSLPLLSLIFSLLSNPISSLLIVSLFIIIHPLLTYGFANFSWCKPFLIPNNPCHFIPLPMAELQLPLRSRVKPKEWWFLALGVLLQQYRQSILWLQHPFASSTIWISSNQRSVTSSSLKVMMIRSQSLHLYLNCTVISPTTKFTANASLRVLKYLHILSIETSSPIFISSQMSSVMAYSPSSVLNAVLSGESESSYFEDDLAPTVEMALHLTLAGKLLATKKMFASNLNTLAARLWKCTDRLSCFDHGKNLFSFEFTHPPDVEAVLEGGPWFIGGDLLLLSCMHQSKAIEQMSFNSTKLWARCFDLPPKCFILIAAMAIGNGLGGFCCTDLPSEDPEVARLSVRRIPIVRRYLRVKLNCDLTKPLKRTQIIAVKNPFSQMVEKITTRLAYERLPPTCYRCGFIGHVVENCSFSGPLLFGEWIRAENFFRYNSDGAHLAVPGWTPPYRSPVARARPAGPPPTQVRNMQELVEDPAIVQANYSSIRAQGPLPVVIPSKGKAPMVEHIHSGNHNSSLVPFVTSSSSAGSPLGTTTGGGGILGPLPDTIARPPLYPSTTAELSDNEDCPVVSYFNPSVPHDDLFSPTNRCLFKPDLAHPAFSSSIKGPEVSPAEKTMNFTELLNSQSVSTNVNNPLEEKKKAAPSGKKRAVGPSSPRPKRGRSAANAVNIA